MNIPYSSQIFYIVCKLVADKEEHRRINFLSGIHESVSKKSKALNHGKENEEPSAISDPSTCQDLVLGQVNGGADCMPNEPKQNCSICAPASAMSENSFSQSTEGSSGDSHEDDSLAIVPVQKLEASSSSISLLIRELPELRPGWPLLRRTILPDRKTSTGSLVQQISVVQWAMRLPSRNLPSDANLDTKESRCDRDEDRSTNLNSESGAIVLVGTENASPPPSPSSSSTELPKELEGLHEKYSATCRLFKYEELCLATSNFMPGLYSYILVSDKLCP